MFKLLLLIFALAFSAARAQTPIPLTTPLTFYFVPKRIVVRSHASELTLGAVIATVAGAELTASLKNGKKHFTYSSAFKKYMRLQGYKRSDFKPLEKYLASQLKSAKKNPQPFIALLNTYLLSGAAPSYTITLTAPISITTTAPETTQSSS